MINKTLKNYNFLIAEIKNLKLDLAADEEDENKNDLSKIESILEIKEAELYKINSALEALKADELEIIKLFYFKHFKIKEIASKLKYNEAYLGIKKRKILKKLTQLLKDRERFSL